MKTQHFFYGLAILAFLSTGCKKDNDYRDKWVGDWDFEVIRHWFLMGENGYSETDTIFYLGRISLINTAKLNINYTEDSSIDLEVDETGILSGFQTGNGYSGGAFKGNDTLHLYLRWGGLGGGMVHNIDGIKRKGGHK